MLPFLEYQCLYPKQTNTYNTGFNTSTSSCVNHILWVYTLQQHFGALFTNCNLMIANVTIGVLF